jgi:hypothetical protein
MPVMAKIFPSIGFNPVSGLIDSFVALLQYHIIEQKHLGSCPAAFLKFDPGVLKLRE